MKRESGWYWVMLGIKWEIAQYNSRWDMWYVANCEDEFSDNAFTQIDERRIVRPEPEVTV